MPQEPWKRASQLQRAVPRAARNTQQPPSAPQRPRLRPWLLLVLIPIAAAGWFYWQTVESTWQRLANRQEGSPSHTRSGQPSSQPKGGEAPAITADKLDGGLGMGLKVYTDYHTLLEMTKRSGIEWEFTAAGQALRLSAPGVKVYVEGKDITAYTLTFAEIWAEENWRWWHKHLKAAGLTEETTATAAGGTGEGTERLSLYGTRSIRYADGWASPAYELAFSSGQLKELRGGIKPGPGPTEPAGR